MDAPRDDLSRKVPFFVERASDDGLTLTGYAATFNDVTRIDSWEGKFDEQIAPGAFRKTIQERSPVLQFDHGSHPLVGSLPIGAIRTLREDRRGLFVEARLHDNWLVEPVRDAIRDGSITGMSFRFNVVKDEWDESGEIPVRTLKEVRLHELGPVVFPAYESTTVGVRSEVQDLLANPDLRAELARALLGTPAEAASGTSSEAAPTDEPQTHSPISRHAALAALALLQKVK